MATDPSSQLQRATTTPIAELSPDIQDPAARVVRGVVTIVWPYSAFKASTAFILAEPDFRLRRNQGQVRVELAGPSAKAFSDAAIAGGDEVALSLDGVAWADKDTKTPIAGSPLPWQLRFKQRLLLQATGSDYTRTIDVNGQAADPEPEPVVSVPESQIDHVTPPRAPTPEIRLPAKRPAEDGPDASEFASPAFIKRARVSYGSLFEGGLDIFDDEALNGGPRKRAKSGRFSSVWRYASASLSPEPAEPEPQPEPQPEPEPPIQSPAEAATPLRTSQMVDGGCQTDDLEFTPPRHVEVMAEPRLGAFGMDDTPSKPPVFHSGVSAPDHVGNFAFGVQHDAGPYLSPSGAYPGLESSYPDPTLGQPALDTSHHPRDLVQPSFVAHALPHDSYHTTPESYHSPIINAEPLPAAIYPAPDEHISSEVAAEPLLEGQADGHTPHAQDINPEVGHGEGAHHTVFLDRIAEPPVSTPWGFVSTARDQSPPRTGGDQDHPVELASSSSVASDAEDADADEDAEPSTFRSPDPWKSSARSGRRPDQEELEDDEEDEDREDPDDTVVYDAQGGREGSHKASSRSIIDTPLDSASLVENATDDSDVDAERDAGGDYDISHYSNLSHVQDDDDASQVESDYSSEDEGHVLVTGSQDNEDDEIDEDAESFDERSNRKDHGNTGYAHDEAEEEYSEEDELDEDGDEDEDEDEDDDEDDRLPPAPAPRPQGPPQVISLLSDSEDDDDATPAPQPAKLAPPAQIRRQPLPQVDGAHESDSVQPIDAADGSSSDSSSASEAEVMEQEEESKDIQAEGHVNISGHATEETEAATDSKKSPDAAILEESAQTSPEAPAGKPLPATKEATESVQQPSEDSGNQPRQLSTGTPDAAHTGEQGAQRPPSASSPDGEVGATDLTTFVAVEETTVVQVTVTEAITSADTEMTDAEPVRPATPTHQTEKPVPTNTDVEMAEDSDDVVDVVEAVSRAGSTEIVKAPGRDADVEMADEPEVAAPTDRVMSPASAPRESSPPSQGGDQAVQVKPTQPKASTDLGPTTSPDLEADSAEPAEKSPSPRAEASQPEEPAGTDPVTSHNPETTSADTPSKSASPPATHEVADGATQKSEAGDGEISEVEENAELTDEEATSAGEADVSEQEDDQEDQEDEAGLPTPDDTQLRDDYSQVEVDLQLTQEASASTPRASPKPAAIEGRMTRSRAAESTVTASPEMAAGGRANEHAAAPSTPRTKSVPYSSDSRQTSEAASSVDGRGAAADGSSKTRAPAGRFRGKEKSERSEADPSVRLARASIASRRSSRTSEQKTAAPTMTATTMTAPTTTTPPENVRVTRAASHNMMRSVSPMDAERDESVRLAKAALLSPSRQLRGGPTGAAPTHRLLTASMREDVPDCISLKVLRHHPTQTVDVMAIVTTEPPEPKRAKGGPRGVLLSFNVTDHSIAPSQVVLVNMFRANKSALPVVKPGDVVLLRQFTVTAMTGRGFGLRANDGSSWAVFDGQDEDQAPQIRGPPVELTKGDKKFAGLLKKYYGELDDAAMAHLRKTNEKATGTAERGKG